MKKVLILLILLFANHLFAQEYRMMVTTSPTASTFFPNHASRHQPGGADEIPGLVTAITTNEIYQIGAGETYTTLNEAINAMSYRRPLNGVGVTLNLKAGFVMSEQVFVNGIDLGWITITGSDASTVIDRSALTADVPNPVTARYPSFGTWNGGTLPVINQLFSMDATGTGTYRDGVSVDHSGKAVVLPGAGVMNDGGIGMLINQVSSVSTSSTIFTGAAVHGLASSRSATANVEHSDFSNAGNAGVIAFRGGRINAYGVMATNCTSYGAQSFLGGNIAAHSSNFRRASTNTVTDFHVSAGSFISANSATGGLSQTANTITSSGIIFQ